MTAAITCRNGHSWQWSEKQPACPQCGATEGLTVTRFTQTGERTFVEMATPAVPATAPLFPGYDVLDVLGAGGMGVVYRARQHALNRVVALKTFHGIEALQPELRERFVAEANAVARLQHPNIIQIFEVGEHAGRSFLALEFVDGTTLSRIMNRKPQAPELAAEIVERLAGAMHHAHQAGILHRDLKPGNVLVPQVAGVTKGLGEETRYDFQRVKIADFGLAKDLSAADGPTQVGDVLGTPSYMAPEQASGVQKKLTPAVDVYALGAILYEMLTGHPPFLGSSSAETVVQVLSQEPVAPRRLRPDCPRDLETICLKCLEKTPSKRYESAATLADDLHRYRSHQPILARPSSAIERLIKWARRKPAFATMAVAGVVLGVAMVIAGILYGLQLRRHNDRLQKLADRERQAQERATTNYQIASETVTEMTEIAANDLSHVPNLDPTRRLILQKALHLQRQLLQQDVSNAAVKNDVAVAARRAGEILELLGDLGEAEEHFRIAIRLHSELVQQTEEPSYRNEWGQDLMRLALLLGKTARRSDADRDFTIATATLRALTERFPASAEYRYQYARSLNNHGGLHAEAKQFSAAAEAFREARDACLILHQRHADEPSYRLLLAATRQNLGLVWHRLGRIADADSAFRDADADYLALVSRYPANRRYRYERALLYSNYGNRIWELVERAAPEDRAAARRQCTDVYREAFEIAQTLASDFPGIPEYQFLAASCKSNLGFMLFRSPWLQQPDRFWPKIRSMEIASIATGAILSREAETEMHALATRYPTVTDYPARFGRDQGDRAMWFRRNGEWQDAHRLFSSAAEWLRLALIPDPGMRRYQDYLRDALWYQAEMALRLGRLDDASSTAQRTAAMIPDDSTYYLYAAQLTAQCASAAKEETDQTKHLEATVRLLREASRVRLLDSRQSKAIAWSGGAALAEVARRGWPEAAVIRSVDEFKPLLQRREMRELLNELER